MLALLPGCWAARAELHLARSLVCVPSPDPSPGCRAHGADVQQLLLLLHSLLSAKAIHRVIFTAF